MLLGTKRNSIWSQSTFSGGHTDRPNSLGNVRIKEFDFYLKRDSMVRRRIKK